eukprot:6361674-Amphidinium_carterae.1
MYGLNNTKTNVLPRHRLVLDSEATGLVLLSLQLPMIDSLNDSSSVLAKCSVHLTLLSQVTTVSSTHPKGHLCPSHYYSDQLLHC